MLKGWSGTKKFYPYKLTVCSNPSSTYTFHYWGNHCLLYWSFISCFTVLVTLSINKTLESSYDFMVLIIWFTSSFEINKVIPFPALGALFQLIFLSNLFIAFEAKLLTGPGELSLAKEIATFG